MLNLYVQEMNKTPASKIAHIEESINEIRMFIELWGDDIRGYTIDPTKIIELQENIKDGRLEIIRLEQLIHNIKNGNNDIICSIENIETNMI